MEKNIIFIDWDGTLCWSRFWESLSKSNVAFKKIVDDFFTFEKEAVNDWMRGKFTSEEINNKISAKSGLPETLVWQTFVSDCKKMHVDPEVISLIKKVREKYIVVLVTGNMDSFSRFTIPALELDKIFDLIINSYNIGYLKTELNGKTFTDCINQFKITNISKSYLLDNSENVCTVFNGLGGKAMKVNSKEDTLNYLQTLLK